MSLPAHMIYSLPRAPLVLLSKVDPEEVYGLTKEEMNPPEEGTGNFDTEDTGHLSPPLHGKWKS